MPLTGQKEIDTKMRNIVFKDDKYIGFEDYRAQNNDYGWFGKDKEIGPDRKLLVTEEVMDSWLASHWGFDLSYIPGNKPSTMPKYIHKYLSTQYFKVQ